MRLKKGRGNVKAEKDKGEVFVDLYYAVLPKRRKVDTVFDETRQKEIDLCNNVSLKEHKYYVWKLLYYGIKKTFNLNPNEITFTKLKSGKWVCDRFYFSLSHSADVVCVTLSNYKTGVDVERVRNSIPAVMEKILRREELVEFGALESALKTDYFFEKWTKKESEFKRGEDAVFKPKEISTDGVFGMSFYVKKDKYFLAVSSKGNNGLKLFKRVRKF